MITININKAKIIGHAMRREAREREFAPLDSAIAKAVPGLDRQSVESAREEIRSRYAVVQSFIDAASDPRGIKAALELA